MKVALVYDRVNKWGGAERLLLTLHEIFPRAPLFTAVYHPKKAPWAKVFPKIETSFFQRIPFLRDKHELLGTLTPIAFESFDFSGFDLVISVTSEAAKGIITKPETLHVCICLTPTRYLWSAHDFYFRNSLLRLVSKPFVSYLRFWDKIASSRPDKFIAISENVRRRIKKYYGRDSLVIYPSVDTTRFKPQGKKKNFFLVVSRLVPYKKVGLVIEVFNKLKLPLVIVGAGRQEKKLKLFAKRNIKFVGEVSQEKLVSYYSSAKALIFPQEEDFGLVPLEAQACGTPVIAFKKGGALESVIEGKTGLFFGKQEVKSLTRAIEKFAQMSFNRRTLRRHAQKYSQAVFKENFRRSLVRPHLGRGRGD